MVRRAKTFLLSIAAVILTACDSALPVTPTPPVDSTAAGNHRPTAAILGTTMTFEGGVAGFSGLQSTDPDGDSLTYRWDFGDGSRRFGAGREDHLYVDNGDYLVTLVVSDPHKAADTATQALTITNQPPYLDSLALSIAASPAAAPVEGRLSFHVADLGIEDHPVATIDWGDGVISQLKTHTYTAPGAYSISIKVTDKDGGTDSTRILEPVWIYDPNQNRGTAPNYEALDLGTLGGKQTVATALNNGGDVVGYGTPADSLWDPRMGIPWQHAFLWRNGVMTDLDPGSANSSAARTINDAGWIGGAVWDYSTNSMATWRNGALQSITRTGWDDNRADPIEVDERGEVVVNVAGHEYPKAYIWRDGALQGLGGLGASQYTWAADRNTRGQIVGASVARFLGTQRDEDHAFIWENGVMRDIGALAKYPCESMDTSVPQSCGYSWAVAINEHGEIVGTSRTSAAIQRAVMWDSGGSVPRDLGFGSGRSRAIAINDRGQIVGDSYGDGDAFFRGSDGTITPLGSLGGGRTHVVAMNNAGIVVGFSTTATGDIHAFVWQQSVGMRDLGAGPFGARGVGSIPTAINDRGDIIGMATPCHDPWEGVCYPGATTRAILWRALAPTSTAAR